MAAADAPLIEQFEDDAVAAAALLLEEEISIIKEVGSMLTEQKLIFVLPRRIDAGDSNMSKR